MKKFFGDNSKLRRDDGREQQHLPPEAQQSLLQKHRKRADQMKAAYQENARQEAALQQEGNMANKPEAHFEYIQKNTQYLLYDEMDNLPRYKRAIDASKSLTGFFSTKPNSTIEEIKKMYTDINNRRKSIDGLLKVMDYEVESAKECYTAVRQSLDPSERGEPQEIQKVNPSDNRYKKRFEHMVEVLLQDPNNYIKGASNYKEMQSRMHFYRLQVDNVNKALEDFLRHVDPKQYEKAKSVEEELRRDESHMESKIDVIRQILEEGKIKEKDRKNLQEQFENITKVQDEIVQKKRKYLACARTANNKNQGVEWNMFSDKAAVYDKIETINKNLDELLNQYNIRNPLDLGIYSDPEYLLG